MNYVAPDSLCANQRMLAAELQTQDNCRPDGVKTLLTEYNVQPVGCGRFLYSLASIIMTTLPFMLG